MCNKSFPLALFTSFLLPLLATPALTAESDILIHEIMYNPAVTNTGGEFVEIYNGGSTPVDVSGWQLEDSLQVMFTLPSSTTIAAGGYLVFYDDAAAIVFYGLNTANSFGPYTGGLDGGGERIALKNASGTVIDEVIYDDNWPWPSEADGNGPSLELLVPTQEDNDEGANWGVGQPYTPGAANNPASPGLGSVVITELMYNPGVLNTGGEYIELYNRSGSTIQLSGWQLAGGIEYTFPAGTTLNAGAYLAVAGDPNVPGFYGISNWVGPYTGKLDNAGELVVLKNSLGQIVDVVNYEAGDPWPTGADGSGPSLELIDINGDNNNPAKWGIGQPYTPGTVNHPVIYIAQPHFSRTSGIFTESFSLILTKLTATAAIYYTLDGTMPSLSSLVYSIPIPISNSTLVKAAVYEPGVGWSQMRAEGFSLINPDIQNFSSNLPIVVVDTFGKTIISTSESEYTLVQTTFIDVDPATGRAVMSGTTDHTGVDGIRIRGHSSPDMPRKSYKLETWNNHFLDKDVTLLGLPAGSDWVLYGPLWDKTHIRDLIAYQWSNEIGRYAPRTRLVELFLNTNGGDVRMDNLDLVPTYSDTTLNYPGGPDFAYPGDYVGVYVLVEKITRNEERVDIQKLGSLDNAEPEITGGYLIQHDCCHTIPADLPFSCSLGTFVFEEPKPDEITAAQTTWIINYLNSVKTVLNSSSFADPALGYSQYLDASSFIDHFWLQEMMRNADAYVVSAFMFKDRLGKLNMGPLWDFNAAFGHVNFMSAALVDGWDYPLRGGDPVADIFSRLRQDPEYELALWDRWFSLRECIFDTDKLLHDIDSYAAVLDEGQTRTFQRWPILGKKLLWNGLGNLYAYPTYQDEVDAMKAWLVARLDWIDAQFMYPPVIFNQDGGNVNTGFDLTMRKPAGQSGTIYYTLDGTDPRQAYTGNAGGTPYTAPITLTGVVTVKARYQNGLTWSALNEATFIVGSPVVINEFMAENFSTIEDPDEPGEFPDWIELYNQGTTAVNLAGKFLTDDLDDPNKYEIPAGVTIEPGEHLIFWADEDGPQGLAHINFKLSKTGESIGLFDTYANGNLPLSIITFGLQSTDVSYGRYPDGTHMWGFMQNPTPQEINSVIDNLPTCSDIWEKGYGLTEDLNADCHVDLIDFAIMASYWLEKNIPTEPVVWDYASEFSVYQGNPNGVWTYGVYDGTDFSSVNFILYNSTAPISTLDPWALNGDRDGPGSCQKNMDESNPVYQPGWPNGMYWEPGQTSLMTPSSYVYWCPTARFTAPVASEYQVDARFWSGTVNGDPTNVYVLVNRTVVHSDQISGYYSEPASSSLFSGLLTLAAGDTVDFCVGAVTGQGLAYDGGFHIVQFDAAISTTAFCGGSDLEYLPGDINTDCVVDLDDFVIFASQWLGSN